MTNTNLNTRILSYDITKIIAMFLVIMIHTSAGFVANNPGDSSEFLIGNIFDSITHIGAPLFLMVSGALILNEQKEFSFKKMKKSLIKTFSILIIWSFIYSFIFNILQPLLLHQEISLMSFFVNFIFGHYHLWYLFMLIGIYLVTPILKLFVKKDNIKYIEWFLLLSVILNFSIPLINFGVNLLHIQDDLVVNIFNKFQLNFLGGYVTYFLLGWYLTNKEISKKAENIIYLLGIVGLFITMLGTQLFITSTNKVYELFYSLLTCNILLYSMAGFTFIQRITKNRFKYNRVVNYLSKYSFGIYLIHPLFLSVFSTIFIFKSVVISLILQFIITGITSILAISVIDKIPGLKKIIIF